MLGRVHWQAKQGVYSRRFCENGEGINDEDGQGLARSCAPLSSRGPRRLGSPPLKVVDQLRGVSAF